MQSTEASFKARSVCGWNLEGAEVRENRQCEHQPSMESKERISKISNITAVLFYLRRTDLYCPYWGGTGG